MYLAYCQLCALSQTSSTQTNQPALCKADTEIHAQKKCPHLCLEEDTDLLLNIMKEKNENGWLCSLDPTNYFDARSKMTSGSSRSIFPYFGDYNDMLRHGICM